MVITEGTYGSRLHGNRTQEVTRLLNAVTQTLESGGRVLIPAFAVGRAQGVVLSLRNYMRRTKQKIPVYVDGLIRNVNGVFIRHPNYLARRYRNEVLKGYDLFYSDGIKPVESKSLREKLLESTEPCVIIASSGMLTGGVSPVYAEKVIGGQKNLLAIVGYQDEESPGQKIIELANLPPQERKVVFNDVEFKVNCQVGRFGLSAHADSLGITSSVKGLRPGLVLINHGNEESLRGLAESLAGELPDARIDVAEPLQTYDFVSSPAKRRVYAFRPGISSISLWRDQPLDSRSTADLWKHLLANDLGGVTLTMRDLLTAWHGPREIAEDEMRAFRKVVSSEAHFRLSPTNPNTVHVLTEAEYTEVASPKPMEQNAARALVVQKLADYGLQRVGFSSDGTIVLYFPTPKYAERCREIIREVKRETLRPVEVWQVPNSQFIKDKLKNELLEKFSIRLGRDPSFSAGRVLVRLPEGTPFYQALGDCTPLGEYVGQFAEETGIELEFRWPSRPSPVPGVSSQLGPARIGYGPTVPRTSSQSGGAEIEFARAWEAHGAFGIKSNLGQDPQDGVTSGGPGPAGEPFTSSMHTHEGQPRPGRLEQNLAKNLIERTFQRELHQPRVGIHAGEGRMTLSFITPQIGRRYASLIAKLSEETGWVLEVSLNAR